MSDNILTGQAAIDWLNKPAPQLSEVFKVFGANTPAEQAKIKSAYEAIRNQPLSERLLTTPSLEIIKQQVQNKRDQALAKHMKTMCTPENVGWGFNRTGLACFSYDSGIFAYHGLRGLLQGGIAWSVDGALTVGNNAPRILNILPGVSGYTTITGDGTWSDSIVNVTSDYVDKNFDKAWYSVYNHKPLPYNNFGRGAGELIEGGFSLIGLGGAGKLGGKLTNAWNSSQALTTKLSKYGIWTAGSISTAIEFSPITSVIYDKYFTGSKETNANGRTLNNTIPPRPSHSNGDGRLLDNVIPPRR